MDKAISGWMRRAAAMAGVVLMLAAGSGCAGFRAFERSTSHIFFPASTEASLGQQSSQQVAEEFTLLSHPQGQAWLDRVGHTLVEHSPRTSQEFKFHLTDSPEVNAFAIPGGYCYVNLGLVVFADNEAQVVAVVGHEINHVTGRHGLLRVQRATGIGLITWVVTSRFRSPAAQAGAVIAAQGGGFLAMQDFSREDEREADAWGVKAMYDAGWDPREAARFFEKLAALQQGGPPNLLDRLLSTHPATPERVENINKQIQQYDLSVPLIVDTPEFQSVKAALRQHHEATQ